MKEKEKQLRGKQLPELEDTGQLYEIELGRGGKMSRGKKKERKRIHNLQIAISSKAQIKNLRSAKKTSAT